MQTSYNPEQTARDIRSKSFLKSRGSSIIMQTSSDKLVVQTSSRTIELGLALMSNKLKIVSKLFLSMKKGIILFTRLLHVSRRAGMPIPMINLQLFMREWEVLNLFTLYFKNYLVPTWFGSEFA